MARTNISGYPCVFPSSTSQNTTYFYKFAWAGQAYRSLPFTTPKAASDAYKRHFLKVVKESFKDD